MAWRGVPSSLTSEGVERKSTSQQQQQQDESLDQMISSAVEEKVQLLLLLNCFELLAAPLCLARVAAAAAAGCSDRTHVSVTCCRSATAADLVSSRERYEFGKGVACLLLLVYAGIIICSYTLVYTRICTLRRGERKTSLAKVLLAGAAGSITAHIPSFDQRERERDDFGKAARITAHIPTLLGSRHRERHCIGWRQEGREVGRHLDAGAKRKRATVSDRE